MVFNDRRYQGTRQIRRPRPPVALCGTEAYFPTVFSVNFGAGCCINMNYLESLTPDNKPMFCTKYDNGVLDTLHLCHLFPFVVGVLTMMLILLQCFLINIVIFRTNRTTPCEKKYFLMS